MVDLHFSQLKPCGANLALCSNGNKEVDLVPGTDLPIVQGPHQSPSDLEQALSAEGGSGKEQERRQLQTMSSVPRQR